MKNNTITEPYKDNYDCIYDHLQYLNLRLVKTLAKKDSKITPGNISKEQVWKIIDELDKPIQFSNNQINQGIQKAWEIIQKKIQRTIEKKIACNFVKLYSVFNLSHDEILIILILLAEDINPSYQEVYNYLQSDLLKKISSKDMILNIIAENTKEMLDKYMYFSPNAQISRYKMVFLEKKKNNYG